MCKLTHVTVLYFLAILNVQLTDAHFKKKVYRKPTRELVKLHLLNHSKEDTLLN